MATRKKREPADRPPEFDAHQFLESAGAARRIITYEPSAVVYSQGDPAASVLYIRQGSVKLSVVSETGKEAVVAVMAPVLLRKKATTLTADTSNAMPMR